MKVRRFSALVSLLGLSLSVSLAVGEVLLDSTLTHQIAPNARGFGGVAYFRFHNSMLDYVLCGFGTSERPLRVEISAAEHSLVFFTDLGQRKAASMPPQNPFVPLHTEPGIPVPPPIVLIVISWNEYRGTVPIENSELALQLSAGASELTVALADGTITAGNIEVVLTEEQWFEVPATVLNARVSRVGGLTYVVVSGYLPVLQIRLGTVGEIVREGNSFSQEITYRSNGSQIGSTVVTGWQIGSALGHLSPGRYNYRVTSLGETVHQFGFDVSPPDSGSPAEKTIYRTTRLPDGTLKLNVALGYGQHTVQASSDFVAWTAVATLIGSGLNSLVPDADAVVDLDAPLHPKRFYRVLVR